MKKRRERKLESKLREIKQGEGMKFFPSSSLIDFKVLEHSFEVEYRNQHVKRRL